MATSKKNRPASASETATSAKVTPSAAALRPRVAKPAAKKPVAADSAEKVLDPAVQASKEALAKALAAAQAVKIAPPQDKPAKTGKAAKARKVKLVRDSFTMPETEYAQIAVLKKRLAERGMVSKKSELLRAGVALLAELDDGELVAVVQKVEVIKTGRPAKSGK